MMLQTKVVCPPPVTRKEKSWEYQQYYLGDKDSENRKRGGGQHHWSGAKSLEWYTGNFISDTMHGIGDYRWRHRGPENAYVTYEGHFYCNRLHGYGTMSYPDGRTFCGLFCNDIRCGPGIQSHAGAREDVGLWHGSQLVRLAWRPPGPSIVPEFMTNSTGRTVVESHRIMLSTEVKKIGETNRALELLKQCGADPRVAVEKWRKLYPKYCTDLASTLCYKEQFEQEYYNEKIYTLQEVDSVPENNAWPNRLAKQKHATQSDWIGKQPRVRLRGGDYVYSSVVLEHYKRLASLTCVFIITIFCFEDYEMNWHRENTLFFIHLLRERPAIWDVLSSEHKNKMKKRRAMEEVAKLMNISVKEVHSKWMSLRGQYSREIKKVAGLGTESDSEPVTIKWFAFNEMKSLMCCNITQDPLSSLGNIKEESTHSISTPQSHTLTPSPTSTPPPSTPTILAKKKRYIKPTLYTEVPQTLKIATERIKDTPNTTPSDDDISAFGVYVSAQLRQFEPRLQSKAKLEINKILFKIEMEHHERNSNSSMETGQCDISD